MSAALNQKIVRTIVAAVVLAIVIVLATFAYMHENRERIVNQNIEYTQDAAARTSNSLNSLFDNGLSAIKGVAEAYGATLTSPDVQFSEEDERYDLMKAGTPFDHLEFTGANGVAYTVEGYEVDASDRDYFRLGMAGETGVSFVSESRVDGARTLMFYSPVRYGEEIVGVMTGIVTEEIVVKQMEVTLFDWAANSYLCMPDGTVAFSTDDSLLDVTIAEYYRDSGAISAADYEIFLREFLTPTPYSLAYKDAAGTGTACVIALDNGWALLQTLSSEATEGMIASANAAGLRYCLFAVVACIIFVAVVILTDRNERKRLVRERREMGYIVSGISQSYSRFVLIDFINDTYRYLAGTVPPPNTIPSEGNYEQLAGYLVDKTLGDKRRAEVAQLVRKENLLQSLTPEAPLMQYEVHTDRSDGHGQIWEHASLVCLERNEAGEPTLIIMMSQDITTIKQEELRRQELLRDALDVAERANRAKSDFLSNMSHDIRTPMNGIVGMTAIASMHLDDPERLRDCLTKITTSSRHLLSLINEVLDMSKIESGKLTLTEEAVALPDLVDNLLDITLPQAHAKRLSLEVNAGGVQHERVIGDPVRLQQVFLNILGNAVKFTPEGGTVEFSLEERPSRHRGMGYYVFTFRDTGVGMSPEFVQRVFEPFSRANDTRITQTEGTGLGMSIARNIVTMMNGDIDVKSEEGKGTTFTVTLPLKLQAGDEEDVTVLQGLSVLVADDDQVACESACGILTDIGMKSDWVLSGEAAVARVEENMDGADAYSAVILDWLMPGLDGVETARRISRLVGSEVPIIILSAYDWSPVEQEARAAGVDAFIAKPLFRSRLVYTLKNVIAPTAEVEETEVDLLRAANFAGKRVLLVEDNFISAEIGREILLSTGIEVECAGDGEEALAVVRDNAPGHFDLVFMDVQMPRMNGYEATRAIRALGRDDTATLPIVALTADAFADDIKRAHEAGMDDHMSKPLEIGVLLSILTRWIGK